MRRTGNSLASGHACVIPSGCILQSRSLYGFPVSTSFLDLVLGAMMKQVCRQTKSLAAESLFWRSFGATDSLDFCLHGFLLVACIW